ncbi:MAG TPA: hypothetical protein VFV59_03025 [Candidatus Limnocylindria bacterium]|nr:hypothetical protein [Candidatus Limnocylindria bacterium]
MTDSASRIARVRLARSLPRLLALPVLLVVVAAAVAVAGLLLLPMPAGAVAPVAAAVLVVVALWWAGRMLSVRLDVEESAVHIHWLGGERRYVLTPGPVTRVRFRGENSSAVRARSSWLGGQLGAARLRDEEDIQIIRLAPTATAILVPTEDGRLAIAAADEEQLLQALTEAARARQRSEAVAPQPAEPEPEPEAPEPEPEPVTLDPRFMTGIERAAYERRLAEERDAAAVAALAAAEAEAARQEEQRLADEAGVPASTAAATATAEARPRARRWRPRIGTRMERPRATMAFILLPLLGAGVAWGIGVASGRMPEPGTDLGRLTSLALVLAGPATSIAAIMARAWWPRIIGVVVAGGLAASVFIGRALLGG